MNGDMSDEIYLSSNVNSGVAIAPFLSKSPPPIPSPNNLDANEQDLSMGENRAVDELNEDSATSGDNNSWNAFGNGEVDVKQHNGLENYQQEQEEEDEWGDFVETDDKTDAINTSNNESNVNVNTTTANVPLARTKPDIPANEEIPRPQVSKVENPVNNSNSNSKTSEPTFIEFNYSNVIDRIFCKPPYVSSSFSFSDSVRLNELDIDTDDVWKQLKTYTSINDASSSLKYKWLLSNLEDNYLNSINVNRVLFKHLQKTSASNFLSNHILQPVKVDQTAQSQSSFKNDANSASIDKTQNTMKSKSNNSLESEFVHATSINDEQQAKSDDQTQIQANSTTTKLNSTPVLDLDLSYFEKKPSSTNTNNSQASNSTSTSSSSSSSALKSNIKTSKNYIDKLLQDIYVNTDKHHSAVSKVDNKK